MLGHLEHSGLWQARRATSTALRIAGHALVLLSFSIFSCGSSAVGFATPNEYETLAHAKPVEAVGANVQTRSQHRRTPPAHTPAAAGHRDARLAAAVGVRHNSGDGHRLANGLRAPLRC